MHNLLYQNRDIFNSSCIDRAIHAYIMHKTQYLYMHISCTRHNICILCIYHAQDTIYAFYAYIMHKTQYLYIQISCTDRAQIVCTKSIIILIMRTKHNHPDYANQA